MREFGAFEAKNKLGHLLDLVEAEESKSFCVRCRCWQAN
jgi:hypothetical protein